MTRHIEVWFDETSDADDPTWCVSLCEADGEEIRLLSTHEDEGDAAATAAAAAAKRGVDCFHRSANGRLS